MKNYLTPYTHANDARMRSVLFNGIFIILEGESDEKFYGKFIDYDKCQSIIVHGRDNVIQTCQILDSDHFDKVVGVIDADFDHLECKKHPTSFIFQTDMHDEECFMLSSAAFDRLVFEFAKADKLTAWKEAQSADLRKHLLQQAAFVGSLLWHSNRLRLNLCFNDLEVKEFVIEHELKTDVSKLVNHVKNKSQRHDLNNDELTAAILEKLRVAENIWQLVRGHDVVDLLGFAFRKTLSSWKAHDVSRDRLEQCLRLAYSEDDFIETHLFKQIREWEATHAPFKVFRELHQQTLKF